MVDVKPSIKITSSGVVAVTALPKLSSFDTQRFFAFEGSCP